jgi:hypothetical protein
LNIKIKNIKYKIIEIMSVVNVKKNYLNKRGIKNFQEWKNRSTSLYIGRQMDHYVKGATGSKWANPFLLKLYGRDKCLQLYENYVKNTPELFNNLSELKDKELGCWCKPAACHGDILIKLLNSQNK